MRDEEENSVVPTPSDVTGAFRALWAQSRGSFSLLIIWVAVGLAAVVALLDGFGIVHRETAASFLGLSRAGIMRHGLLYQFLTAPMLHGGVTHLLFNMLALWMLGPSVETAMGRSRYTLFTLVCGFCSMLGFLLLSRNPNAIVMGYSGIIFGILVAQAIFFPENRILMFYFFPMKMTHAVFVLAAVELYLTVSPERDGIANSAHLFGALAGWGFLKVVRRLDSQNREERTSVSTVTKSIRRLRPRQKPAIPREL